MKIHLWNEIFYKLLIFKFKYLQKIKKQKIVKWQSSQNKVYLQLNKEQDFASLNKIPRFLTQFVTQKTFICNIKKFIPNWSAKIHGKNREFSDIVCRNFTHASSTLFRTSLCKYKREERDIAYILAVRETRRRYIWRQYCAGTTRGASLARSMDHRSVYRKESAGGCIAALCNNVRRVQMHALTSHVHTTQQELSDARERWARVRCNKGDNGHYYRRVTSLETTNRARFAG